jgi:ketosteroid isomerase-like protein
VNSTPFTPRRFGLLLALLGACVPSGPLAAQAATSDSAAIGDAGRRFSAAYVRGDAATMAGLYTADAVIFPERSDAISGTAAIARYWTIPPGRRVTRHVMTPTRITVDGDHAYDYGTFEIAGERDGASWGPTLGKYLVVWRREQGAWRMQLDMWNSGPPAAP